ncbi:serine/threonine-protein phosphatase [candidate division KSB1 bacterium]|nr:serine/threonine-protein phosphatase [candidate division KSB1 bacterium]
MNQPSDDNRNSEKRKRVQETKRFSAAAGLNSVLDRGIRHQIGKATHRGKVRATNEDSIAAFEFTYIFKSVLYPVGLYLVADGMGGMDEGETASKIAATSITNEISRGLLQSGWLGTNNSASHEDFQQLMENAVYQANDSICYYGQQAKKELGATLTAALIHNRNAYIMNVGDSRAYLFNPKKGLELITQDHSLVFRLYLMGHLQFDEIYEHPQRSQILRALGEAGLKQNLEEMAIQEKHPYLYTQELVKGDALLICSDGLWQMIRDRQIEDIIRNNPDPQTACEKLIIQANIAGGEDNISAIVIKFL